MQSCEISRTKQKWKEKVKIYRIVTWYASIITLNYLMPEETKKKPNLRVTTGVGMRRFEEGKAQRRKKNS